VHGRRVLHDDGLLLLLSWLVEQRVNLNAITRYGESALRVLSRIGRFDAVRLLLDKGADASQLAFSPLHSTVAFGALAELAAALPPCGKTELEAADFWSRTPLLLAAQLGDVEKMLVLLDHGANFHAVGRCRTPLLFYPIAMGRADVLHWLIERGADVEQTDEFGETPLMSAAEGDHTPSMDVLLAAGAAVDREKDGQTALSVASGRACAQRLLAAGAAPAFLSQAGTRLLLGFSAEPDESALDCSHTDFEAARVRRYATRNGEDITTPYYLAMIRSGVSGHAALQALAADPDKYPRFGDDAIAPVWCAQRFGQSITFLPDGRIVQIAGEHEDHYDPDFCIYNDVFVHGSDGSIKVHGYPESDFPPTDFHSATLVGKCIYVIGNLGYPEHRTVGTTPVFQLDTERMTITRVATTGEAPSWLHRHHAVLVSPHEIEVSGGTVIHKQGADFDYAPNTDTFVLNLDTRVWHKG
jgi:ankyrin repeat protein